MIMLSEEGKKRRSNEFGTEIQWTRLKGRSKRWWEDQVKLYTVTDASSNGGREILKTGRNGGLVKIFPQLHTTMYHHCRAGSGFLASPLPVKYH